MAVKGFVYRGKDRTTEDVKRAATMSTGNYDSTLQDGFQSFKVREGENCIRIFPPTWSEKEVEVWGKNWAIILSEHRNIGVDRGSFLCLEAMREEPCPICDMRRQSTDDEERFQLSPNKRALCWVINRDDEAAGPQLWSMPIKKVFKVINARSVDRKTGALVLIDDPVDGYDIFFNCENAGKMTAEYTGIELDRDPSNLGPSEEIEDRWMKYVMEHPLPSVLLWPEPDYLEKVLSGRVSKRSETAEEEATEEEGAPPPRSRRQRPSAEETSPRSTRRGRGGDPPEEDETPLEEEEGTDPETEADPEPPPPRSTRRGRNGGEEEPPPRRTARRSEPEAAEEPEADPPPRRTARQRPSEDEAAPAPSRQARGSLERLRPARQRGRE